MYGMLMSIIIFVVINIIASLLLYHEKKRAKVNDKNVKSHTFYFAAQFLKITLFPMVMLIIIIAKSFFEFVIIYAYFVFTVLFANKLYKKNKI